MGNTFNSQLLMNYIQSHNLTKTEFCKQCGISLATLNKVINHGNYRLTALFKISQTTNIPVHVFFI